MTSVEILQKIIFELDLVGHSFCLIEHPVGINWRQCHTCCDDKVCHIEESLLQPDPVNETVVSGKELLSKKFDPSIFIKSEGNVISIKSKMINSKKRNSHLPFMNFHPHSHISKQDLISAIAIVTNRMPGFLLESGRYFHFYGIDKLSYRQWLKFNAQFLMPTILVSERYIGHSIYKGYNSLRLTADNIYKPKIPTLIHNFEGTVC